MFWKLFYLCEDQNALTQMKKTQNLEIFDLTSNVALYHMIATV